MTTITKKDIREAFHGFANFYIIETIKKGKAYKIIYYAGFHSNNITSSLLRHHIYNWDPIQQTFIVGVNPKMAENCLGYNMRIVRGELVPK